MKKAAWIFVLFFLMTSQGCPLEAKALKGIKVVKLIQTTKSWNGSSLPAYPKGNPQITILKITIAPHVRLPLHKHPVINAGVLLQGNLTVITEKGKTLYLKAGEPIVEVVNTWHYGINEGNTPVVIVMVYAGTPGTPLTILKKK